MVAVEGDCGAAGLGLTISDRQLLIKNVNVVFHAAATVNFDEKLKTAFAINVKGTESVLDLCKQVEKLKVSPLVQLFVYLLFLNLAMVRYRLRSDFVSYRQCYVT